MGFFDWIRKKKTSIVAGTTLAIILQAGVALAKMDNGVYFTVENSAQIEEILLENPTFQMLKLPDGTFLTGEDGKPLIFRDNVVANNFKKNFAVLNLTSYDSTNLKDWAHDYTSSRLDELKDKLLGYGISQNQIDAYINKCKSANNSIYNVKELIRRIENNPNFGNTPQERIAKFFNQNYPNI